MEFEEEDCFLPRGFKNAAAKGRREDQSCNATGIPHVVSTHMETYMTVTTGNKNRNLIFIAFVFFVCL
jgi:hypothetical protein